MKPSFPRYFVYGLVDPRDGQIRYVGKSSNGVARPRDHTRPARVANETGDKNVWVKELLALSIFPEIVNLETCTPDNLVAAENWNIIYYRSLGFNLTNSVKMGCHGPTGYHHTQDAKDRIGAATLGRKHSEEAKKKISMTHSGKKLSKEHLDRIIEANTGRVVSQTTRDKLSKAHKGRPKPNGSIALKQWYIDNPDNSKRNQKMAQTSAHPVIDELGNIYSSAKDAARKTGINKGSVHKNLRVNKIGLPVKMIDKYGKAFAYTEELPDYVARKGKPVIVSDGREFLSLKETAEAVGIVYEVVQRNIKLNSNGLPLILLKKSGLGFAYVSEKPTESKSKSKKST